MDVLNDLARRGCKILIDTKAKKSTTEGITKPLSVKPTAEKPLTIHQSFVAKVIKEKPAKKFVVDFFKEVIEAEERKL